MVEADRRVGQFIIAHPEKFKVCTVCERINWLREPLCCSCHSYRFESDPEVVRAQGQVRTDMGLSKYGYVPRVI